MEKIKLRTSFLLFIVGMLYGSALPVEKNLFSFVPKVFIEKSSQTVLSAEVTKACPDLWTDTTTEFLKNSNSGLLGSREELSRLSLICQDDVSPLCLTASGLVNYICDPTKEAKYSKVTNEANNTASAMCFTFQNNTFLAQLREAALHSLVSENNKVSNVSSDSSEFNISDCVKQCGSSPRLCQIILQSLGTIVYGVKPKLDVTESKPEPTTAPHATAKPVNASSLQTSLDNAKTTTIPAKLPEAVTEKTTTQSAVKEEEIKNWDSPNLSPDGADEDDLDDMERPIPLDDDPDLGKESDAVASKQNDVYVATPTKPPQSYDSQSEIDEDPVNTHFIFYFLAFVVISVCGYLLYQRRYRIIALVLEGRGGSARRRARAPRSRGSSGSYHKLVNNLEEAITSHSVKNSNVVY